MDPEKICINIYTHITAMLNQFNLHWCVNYKAEQLQQSAQLDYVLKRFLLFPRCLGHLFWCLSPSTVSTVYFSSLSLYVPDFWS